MAESFNTKLAPVGFYFLQQLKVNVTKTGFYKSLQENPFYPSLYSLSDTLTKYKIENSAFKIEPEKITGINCPFIAYIHSEAGGDDFVTVTSINNNNIVYTADGRKSTKNSLKNFLQNFKDIILVAEVNNHSGESDYTKKRSEELIRQRFQYLFIALAFVGLVFLSIKTTIASSLLFSCLTILAIIYAGLFFSVLLLIFEIDKSNIFVKSICTGGNSKVNCNAVLDSNASGLFGISWSEYGFFFFAGLFLMIFLPLISFQNKVPLLAIIFTASAFYIPFSIYYQYKIVKQWCTLCLAVQLILFVGLIWAFINYWSKGLFFPKYTVSNFFFIAFSFLIPTGCWFFLKPLFKKAKGAADFSAAHKRLLYNPDIFKSILEQQPVAANGWQHLGVDIGNATAENTIIKVCNPYCGPCAKAHVTLEQLIEQNKNVRLKIIFTATSSESDVRNKPVKHILTIADGSNNNQTKQALADWYNAEEKNYDAFAAKYPLQKDLKEQNEKVDAMHKWCEETAISFTPTIFINGWRLPEMYSLEELKNVFV